MTEYQLDQSMVSKDDETPRAPRTLIPQFNIPPPAPPGPQGLIRPASMSSTNSSAISQLVSDPDITDAGNWSSESSPKQHPPTADPNAQVEQVTTTTTPTFPHGESLPPQQGGPESKPERQPVPRLEILIDVQEQEAVQSVGECEEDRDSEASTVRWGDVTAVNRGDGQQRSALPVENADDTILREEIAEAPSVEIAQTREREDDEQKEEHNNNQVQLHDRQHEAAEAGLTARERLELRLERNKQAGRHVADVGIAEMQET